MADGGNVLFGFSEVFNFLFLLLPSTTLTKIVLEMDRRQKWRIMMYTEDDDDDDDDDYDDDVDDHDV